MLSAKRRILFSLLPSILLLLLLVLVEIALRFLAPALDSPLVRGASVDSVGMLQINRGYLERYFPANAPMIPELKPTLMRRQKGPRVFRVFCIGESSMFGTPYELSATIPALVRKQLRHLFPGSEIEVVNFGASAINSNVIRDLAPRLAELEPDAVLAYFGHNEFYGPDGVGAPWIEKQFPLLTRLKYRAREIRIVRLAQKALAGFRHGGQDEDRNLMKQVSGGATVVSGSPEERRILLRFGENLKSILDAFRERGIPVIVSDVSSNLTFPPFVSPRTYEAIPPLVASGNPSRAIAAIDSIRRGDTLNAFIDYWRGRALLALGETAAADRFLRRARDEDLLKFRAPEMTDSVIRAVCRSEAVPCLSADSLLSALSPSGITDRTLFWEHLHPNAKGYFILAKMFVEAMLSLRIIPRDTQAIRPSLLPFDPDSLSLCWPDLAYGEISVKGLIGRWPFSGFSSPSPLYDSADGAEKKIVMDLYSKKAGWTDACLGYAEHAAASGRPQEAMRTYGALIEEFPFEFYPRYRLAALRRDAGDLPGAVAEYRRAITLNAGYVPARVDLGLILNNLGEFDEARTHLTRALDLAGGSGNALTRAEICYGLAALSANSGDIPKAREWIDQSLRLAPAFAPARILKGQLMDQR